MKVLIVDDNVEVQNIIREIAEKEGCLTRTASDIKAAVEKISVFRPDIVFLDAGVGGTDASLLIPEVRESVENFELKIVLLASQSDHVPSDVPEIVKRVDKPFKVPEIVNAIYGSPSPARTQPAPKKKKSSFWDRLFRRKKEKIPAPVKDPSASGVTFGTCYVAFEPEPKDIYLFAGLFNTAEYDVLIVTSAKIKAVKERFDYKDIKVKMMADKAKADVLAFSELGTSLAFFKEFINSSNNPVLVFDNFIDILEANGANDTLKMFSVLLRDTSGKPRTVAVSVPDEILSEKDRGILLHDMKQYIRID